ncbi:MAG: nitroreductase family protein [Deltaproteobacteria bacterium]|jgi:iodotyrosine deiodinase|nr:nitroreductase family protein [Deltaproteobacteria bacterium]
MESRLTTKFEPQIMPTTYEHQASSPLEVSHDLLNTMLKRRSIRSFSNRAIELGVFENAVKIAASAPSGANRQAWFFAIIQNPEVKKQIRDAAEKVEFEFYHEKAPATWLEDLKPFGTNHQKPYLTEASTLIAVFSRTCIENREKPDAPLRAYYPIESTGIATGFLISALHQSGIATLTHTPKPMYFLNQVLKLDKTYRPFMIIVAGYPKIPIALPEISRKPFSEVSNFY